ncbi:MAG: hypothetical protein IT210_04020 [Armatimonadetes bacterium]|nr:hypothetical protein [Armatimonadota bacterium]
MKLKCLWALCFVLAVALCPAFAEPLSQVNVKDYGAKGDGATDDTAAFQAAMAAVADQGGTVTVPVGNYLIKTHLNVPNNVTLEGVWKIPTAWTQYKGSTLLAVEGRGAEEGTPFITLNANSTLKGITVFYPNQKPEKIAPYPWCIASGGGDNPSIVDCLLVNPYQGVDFGTRNSGRHYIRNLYGQPLRRGVFVDKCYDVGRIENVHFWPFWNWEEKTGTAAWLTRHGEAFIFGRTDWEYVCNTFVFGYGIGYRFIQTKDGAMNGNLLGIGADAAHIAVLVEATQPPGLLITNGEFVSFPGDRPTEVVVQETHGGVVQFMNCAFWGPAHQIARIAGTGTVSFNSCNFVDWDREGKGIPAIELSGGHLTVSGSNFMKGSPQAALTGKAQSAIVMGNRMGGPLAVSNPARADLQIGLNVFSKAPARPAAEPGAILFDDTDRAVKFTGRWLLAPGGGNYFQGARWAYKGEGEAEAVFIPDLPRSGRYRVYAYFGPDPAHDHASNAPVEIRSADGPVTKRIDLRPLKGQWVNLGSYRFAKGRKGSVIITNRADGNVLADAVKWVGEEK